MATNGMAATSHPLATGTALDVLRNGGNAVDAAIAASAVLCVVEPQMTGIGGDCFAIVHQPDGSVHGLNGSGRAPAGAHLEWYLQRCVKDLNTLPVHTVTVPGALKAWDTLLGRFGTRDLGFLLADAIGYASNGFPVAPRVAYDWATLAVKLASNRTSSMQLLPQGRAPHAGDIVTFPALAKTLKLVASEGIDAFYTGSIAAEIAQTVQSGGGFLTEQDLAAVSADWLDPITANYNNVDIHQIPPNGQGITALVLLKLLQRLNACELEVHGVQRVHLEIEAGRLAYAVRDAYVGDANTMCARVDQMLCDSHIETLANLYDPQQRNTGIELPRLPESDTVYLTVVDKDLQAVSFINSLYSGFGSGIVTPESGVVLQNRGACFSLVEDHDNAIGPSKRPMHTIIPGLATRNNKLAWTFGVMGGAYQPLGHTHLLTNMIDYGMDPQQALDHGRVFWGIDDVIDVESGVAQVVSPGLQSKGHQVRMAEAPIGGGQVIAIDHERGVMMGASDSRKDGMAAGY